MSQVTWLPHTKKGALSEQALRCPNRWVDLCESMVGEGFPPACLCTHCYRYWRFGVPIRNVT